MMRVILAAMGSRGDVQPFLALARCLVDRGHHVVLSAPENFQGWIEGAGIRFASCGPDVQKLLSEIGERVFDPRTFFRVGRSFGREVFERLLSTCEKERAQILVAGPLIMSAPTISELLGMKHFWATFYPATYRTAEYPFPFSPFASDRKWLNRLTWSLAMPLLNLFAKRDINAVRNEHGLGPISDLEEHFAEAGPVLLAADPRITPVPADWRYRGHATGYWFLDDQTPLDSDLVDFLEAGPRPIYIGFGSMPIARAQRRLWAIVQAVEALGARALISSGWANLGAGAKLPESCKLIPPVSHAILFPKLAAVVHHCGAGTTAAALRAGVPHIPVPHAFDQFTWAARIAKLGVATPRLDKAFTAEALAGAIALAVRDQSLRARAKELGAQVRGTHGVIEAARLLEAAAGAVKPPLLTRAA